VANDLSALGDLVVTVGGDLSPLEAAVAKIPEVAQQATSLASTSFAGFDTALNQSAATMDTTAAEAKVLDNAIAKLNESTRLGSGGLYDSTQGWMNLQPAMQSTSLAAKDADASFGDVFMTMAGGLLTLAALKSAIFGVVEAFGSIEKASLALGAIVGNATDAAKAIETAKRLANELGVAQDQLIKSQQRMIAIGVELKDVPRIMEAIANGAAAMNMPFQTVNQRFDQIIDSGALMVRGLVSMGIQIEDVAKVLGMAGAETKDVQAAFRTLADAQDRAIVLSSALLEKHKDVALTVAGGVEAAWTRIKNATETAMQDIGRELDGFKGTAQAIGLAIKGIEDIVMVFILAFKEVANVAVAWGGIMYNAISGVAKALWDVVHGEFAKANQELLDANTRGAAYWTSFLDSVKKDWMDTGKAIDKIWSDT